MNAAPEVKVAGFVRRIERNSNDRIDVSVLVDGGTPVARVHRVVLPVKEALNIYVGQRVDMTFAFVFDVRFGDLP